MENDSLAGLVKVLLEIKMELDYIISKIIIEGQSQRITETYKLRAAKFRLHETMLSRIYHMPAFL